MNKNFFDAHTLSVSEYINLLFEATANGVLSIPRYEDNSIEQGPDYIDSFVMNWNENNIDGIIIAAEKLISDIKTIASMTEESEDGYVADVDGNDKLYAVWKMFISSMDDANIDREKFNDICERMDGDNLTDEEWEYYDSVITKRTENASKRLGRKVYCYNAIIRAQRLYKLILLGAPEVVINNEANMFAEAFVINTFAERKIRDKND